MSKILTGLQELYNYRALVFSLARRELKSKYRGSALGFLWSFMNPLLTMLVYVLVFSIYLRQEIQGGQGPYWAYLLTGLVPWIWFSTAVLEGTYSIVGGGGLISKVLFPPQVLPTVSVTYSLVNFLLTMPLMMILVIIPCGIFGVSIIMLPVVIALQLLFTQGLALLLSALNAYFRDVQYFAQNFLTLWFFLCPIVYEARAVDQIISKDLPALMPYTPLITLLNPMACISRSYNDILFYHTWPQWEFLLSALVFGLVFYVIGHTVFERYRDRFAEVV